MAERISKRTVDAAKPGNRDRFIWDEDLKGFGLKVTPLGRKIFVAQYRPRGSHQARRVTIGLFGTLTAEEARNEARRLLGQAATGGDPADERKRIGFGQSMAEVIESFFELHVEAKRKKRTAEEYRRVANIHILPRLGKKPVKDIDRGEIERLHRDMRDAPYAANRTLAFLSKFFNWCESMGLRPEHSNPCRHIEKYREEKREKYMSPMDMERLGETLDDMSLHAEMTPWVIAAIRLLLLTGSRLSEILTLQWGYVDLEGSRLNLPDSKTGKKTVYLNPAAREVLASIPKVSGNPHVICGGKEGAHLVNLQKPWRAIRKRARLDDVRIHDLRHSFASVAAASGLSLPMIGKLLGLTQPQTTARYAHLASDPVSEANRLVGERIAGAMIGDRPPIKSNG